MLKPDLAQAAQGIDSTVVVFGSARVLSPEDAQTALQQAQLSGDSNALAVAQRQLRSAHYYDQARLFARLVAGYSAHQQRAQRLFIATGGGPGIMEAANRGAHEMGAQNVGLNIALPREQNANPYVTPSLNFKFHYYALRKMHFVLRAKALVSFPGGFGTQHEVHLAQRKIMKLEIQAGCDVGVGVLLARQGNVQTHALGAHLVCAAVGRFHDAGAATGGNEQALRALLVRAVAGHKPGKQARLVVVMGAS